MANLVAALVALGYDRRDATAAALDTGGLSLEAAVDQPRSISAPCSQQAASSSGKHTDDVGLNATTVVAGGKMHRSGRGGLFCFCCCNCSGSVDDVDRQRQQE